MKRAILALAVAVLGFGGGFLWFLEAASAPPEAPGRATDAIVVLTGGSQRVETGLLLLDEGAAPLLVVSGVQAGLTLAELARAHGRAAAGLEGRVALGHAAATTIGNAAEVAAFARARRLGSIRLVTAGYHMPRALLELRRAMPDVAVLAHPVTPTMLQDKTSGNGQGLPRMRRWTLMLGEYVKYGAAAAGVSRVFPAKELVLR